METVYVTFCGAFILLVTVITRCTTDVSTMRFLSFPTCDRDTALGNDVIDTFKMRSLIECCTSCGKRNDCLAVNFCTNGWNGTGCDLLGRVGDCTELAAKTGCRYRVKAEKGSLPCLNGGTWIQDNQSCICMPGWAGEYCERLVRDCHEGKLSGQTGMAMSTIQPIGCAYFFKAYCVFTWSNTYVLRRAFSLNAECRGSVLNPNMNWNDFKNSFGIVQCDLFLGLENLWYVLRQGTYHLHVYIQYKKENDGGEGGDGGHDDEDDGDGGDGGGEGGGDIVVGNVVLKTVSIYYWNFKMASEDEGYAIQYSSFTANNGGEDGFMLTPNTPTRFCTRDRDCDTCVRDRGVAWWYTPNCDNYPLTVDNKDLKWPISGVNQTLDLVVMQIWPASYYWQN